MPPSPFLLIAVLVMYIARVINAALPPAPSPAVAPLPPPGCRDKCGNVSIPYPFGIGEGCYLHLPGSGNFSVTCDNSTGHPRPYITDYLGDRMAFVNNITLETAQMVVFVKDSATSLCVQAGNYTHRSEPYVAFEEPFLLSPEANVFIVVGCHATAKLKGSVSRKNGVGRPYKTGCFSYCANQSVDAPEDGAECNGIGCCEACITPGLWGFAVDWDGKVKRNRPDWLDNPCQYAFVAEKSWYKFKRNHLTGSSGNINSSDIPIVLDWAIRNDFCPPEKEQDVRHGACHSTNSKCNNASNSGEVMEGGYVCTCSHGYSGNPYIPNGCKDINECENKTICGAGKRCSNTGGSYICTCKFGRRPGADNDTCEPIFSRPAIAVMATVVLASLLVLSLIFILMERKKRMLRDSFNRNGGQLLKSIKIDIFTKAKLDEITKNYSTIIGKGGFGNIYMGTINGNVRVAVKRSITVNEARQKDFANEITIQSQISHRNLVKLLGCCLETDVPMLVYEFVPRGSLCKVLHGENNNKRHPLSLRVRLDIAINSADALAYMHSYARQKILHGDVKSGNILLDENFMPKVSDFGTSRLLTIGKDHTTFVVGDMNYIDPVYMKTGLLTEKSDVYSFGIVLLELMTGNKARYNGNNSLPINFCAAYKKESRAYEMYDREIMSAEQDIKCIQNVGRIAVHCLKDYVDERPAMTEVVKDLQMVQSEWMQIHGQMERHYLTNEICI